MTITKQIEFVQHHTSPLDAGEYSVTVSAEVDTKEVVTQDKKHITQLIQEKFSSNYRLVVKGERFNLKQDIFHAVYPPENSCGAFETDFPHIVLTQTALPWEREIVSGKNETPTPWLALLLFDENDPVPESRDDLKLKDLVPPSNTGIFQPGIFLEYGESETDPVTVMDVPVELFNAIAPSAEELPYLAHVRNVSVAEKALEHKQNTNMPLIQAKDSPEDSASDASYAVIISNRLPAASTDESPKSSGIKNTVHLVSLEGYGEYLPDSNGTPSDKLKDFASVRLVSLKSWQFVAKKPKFDMQQEFATLNATPKSGNSPPWNFRIPDIPEPESPDPEIESINKILSMGYTAMDHHTRKNDKTVSWYRGPLLPYDFDSGENPFSSVDRSDQAVRYDPYTGIFDVSYACAWELGKMLALNNMNFAEAWTRLRQKNIRKTMHIHKQQRLNFELGISLPSQRPLEKAAAYKPELHEALHSGLSALTGLIKEPKEQKEVGDE